MAEPRPLPGPVRRDPGDPGAARDAGGAGARLRRPGPVPGRLRGRDRRQRHRRTASRSALGAVDPPAGRTAPGPRAGGRAPAADPHRPRRSTRPPAHRPIRRDPRLRCRRELPARVPVVRPRTGSILGRPGPGRRAHAAGAHQCGRQPPVVLPDLRQQLPPQCRAVDRGHRRRLLDDPHRDDLRGRGTRVLPRGLARRRLPRVHDRRGHHPRGHQRDDPRGRRPRVAAERALPAAQHAPLRAARRPLLRAPAGRIQRLPPAADLLRGALPQRPGPGPDPGRPRNRPGAVPPGGGPPTGHRPGRAPGPAVRPRRRPGPPQRRHVPAGHGRSHPRAARPAPDPPRRRRNHPSPGRARAGPADRGTAVVRVVPVGRRAPAGERGRVGPVHQRQPGLRRGPAQRAAEPRVGPVDREHLGGARRRRRLPGTHQPVAAPDLRRAHLLLRGRALPAVGPGSHVGDRGLVQRSVPPGRAAAPGRDPAGRARGADDRGGPRPLAPPAGAGAPLAPGRRAGRSRTGCGQPDPGHRPDAVRPAPHPDDGQLLLDLLPWPRGGPGLPRTSWTCWRPWIAGCPRRTSSSSTPSPAVPSPTPWPTGAPPPNTPSTRRPPPSGPSTNP
ncbi:Uncharacterised protein [Rothia kristinae]|nr:Uncharacterised protein [Rothia kristinae]